MQIDVPYNLPIALPVSGCGAVVVDAKGQTLANCPNSHVADKLAQIINAYAVGGGPHG